MVQRYAFDIRTINDNELIGLHHEKDGKYVLHTDYLKLLEYAQHKDGCASLKDYNGIKHWLHNCDCGLDDLIGGE